MVVEKRVLEGSIVAVTKLSCTFVPHRVLTTLIGLMLLRNWSELRIILDDACEEEKILAAIASSTQGPPTNNQIDPLPSPSHPPDAENGFSYLKRVMTVLCDRGSEFWAGFFKEQNIQLLNLLLSPPQ